MAVETDSGAGAVISCAYVPSPGADISPRSLRRRLSEVLPHYMLPVQWLCLEALPQNANGKIDRPKLREQFRASAVARSATPVGAAPHQVLQGES